MKTILIYIAYSILFVFIAEGGVKKNDSKLTIYFKTSDCVKCYLSLGYLNEISKKVFVECLVNSDESEYAKELLNNQGVNVGSYSIRNKTEAEKSLNYNITTTYIFETNSLRLFGGYMVIEYLHTHLDSLLAPGGGNQKKITSGAGFVPIMQPFGMVGKKCFVFDEKLNRLFIDSDEGNQVIATQKYFNPDSTFMLYKVDPDRREQYFKQMADPKAISQSYIYSITSFKNIPVFTGTFNWSLTPLFKKQKRAFLILFKDSVISRNQFTYIDNSRKYSLNLEPGLSFDKNANVFNSFYSFVWQRKRKADSLFVGHFFYNTKDTTWYQDKVYLLDTSKAEFDYGGGLQFISGNYAIHSELPILYKFPDREKIDLSHILTLVFNQNITRNSPLPRGMNLAGIYHDCKTIKLLCGSQKGLLLILYHLDSEIYEIRKIKMPYPFNEFRQIGFDDSGIPVIGNSSESVPHSTAKCTS